jgi:CxxC-x17-CxxC domain-containing protein
MKNNNSEVLDRLEAQLEELNKKLDILIRQTSHKTSERGSGSGRDFEERSNKMQYKAVCSGCGKPCGVPFKPSGGRPVFCSECYAKQQDGGGDEQRFNKQPRDFRKPAGAKKPFFNKSKFKK